MLHRFSLIVVLLAGSSMAMAQDCVVSFSLSSASSSFQLNNRTRGCANWGITYTSSGFTALTLALQSAPDSSGVPGAWVTFAGTLLSGSNPSTTITQASASLSGYFPWLRANLSGLTGAGTVTGIFYGYRIQPQATTIAGNVTVIQPTASLLNATVVGPAAEAAAASGNPVRVAGVDSSGNMRSVAVTTTGNVRNKPATTSLVLVDGISNTVAALQGDDTGNTNPIHRVAGLKFNGSTWDRDFICGSQAVFNLSGAGNTEIIALSGSTTIRICHLSLATTAAEDIKVTRGTGANCGTATADVTGLYKAVMALALDFGPQSALRGAASGAICINQSLASATGGVVIYAQF